jgi:hypothetical protein
VPDEVTLPHSNSEDIIRSFLAIRSLLLEP